MPDPGKLAKFATLANTAMGTTTLTINVAILFLNEEILDRAV